MNDPAENSWQPTHVVPQGGLSAWVTASGEGAPIAMPELLPVQVVRTEGARAQIACSNGWQGWVDGSRLVAKPPSAPAPPPVQAAPTAPPPVQAAPTAPPPTPDQPVLGDDPELQALLDGALQGYERLLGALEAGEVGEEEFRRRSFRTGLVLHDEQAWLYDLADGVWVRYDGLEFAVLGEPPEGWA